jgi:hypothetical protein
MEIQQLGHAEQLLLSLESSFLSDMKKPLSSEQAVESSQTLMGLLAPFSILVARTV